VARLRQIVGRLAVTLPDMAEATAPVLQQVEGVAEQVVPDPLGPAHRAFRPAQVLVGPQGVGFIDFDGFGQAEAAFDIAEFRATLRGDGLPHPRSARFNQLPEGEANRLDALCDMFLAAYLERARVSRRRVWAWEALALLSNVLDDWTKVRPERLAGDVLMLERHLATPDGTGA
jgi:Ser/Thr protein kinase RdoA (MazF antagonist)